ncbi:MAG: (2Fe-2S) ferredoxin domain-containing protein [Pyrinomonadaceae bacterium]
MSTPKIINEKKKLLQLAPVAKVKLKHHVFVCCGKSCTKVGAGDVIAEFANELEAREMRWGKVSKGRNPKGEIMLTECGSVGFCSVGTAVLVYPEGIWYAQVRGEDVKEIIERHLIKGEVVERLVLKTFEQEQMN